MACTHENVQRPVVYYTNVEKKGYHENKDDSGSASNYGIECVHKNSKPIAPLQYGINQTGTQIQHSSNKQIPSSMLHDLLQQRKEKIEIQQGSWKYPVAEHHHNTATNAKEFIKGKAMCEKEIHEMNLQRMNSNGTSGILGNINNCQRKCIITESTIRNQQKEMKDTCMQPQTVYYPGFVDHFFGSDINTNKRKQIVSENNTVTTSKKPKVLSTNNEAYASYDLSCNVQSPCGGQSSEMLMQNANTFDSIHSCDIQRPIVFPRPTDADELSDKLKRKSESQVSDGTSRNTNCNVKRGRLITDSIANTAMEAAIQASQNNQVLRANNEASVSHGLSCNVHIPCGIQNSQTAMHNPNTFDSIHNCNIRMPTLHTQSKNADGSSYKLKRRFEPQASDQPCINRNCNIKRGCMATNNIDNTAMETNIQASPNNQGDFGDHPVEYYQCTSNIIQQQRRKRQRPNTYNTSNASSSRPGGVTNFYIDTGDCDWSCNHCGARFWYGERLKSSTQQRVRYSHCCGEGKVRLQEQIDPPDSIKQLLKDKHFMESIRAYNQMFSMTSFDAQIDDRVNDGRGPYVFKISGQIYHWIGTLCPPNNETPKFLQLYIYDTKNEVGNRLTAFGGTRSCTLKPEIVRQLIEILDEHN